MHAEVITYHDAYLTYKCHGIIVTQGKNILNIKLKIKNILLLLILITE